MPTKKAQPAGGARRGPATATRAANQRADALSAEGVADVVLGEPADAAQVAEGLAQLV